MLSTLCLLCGGAGQSGGLSQFVAGGLRDLQLPFVRFEVYALNLCILGAISSRMACFVSILRVVGDVCFLIQQMLSTSRENSNVQHDFCINRHWCTYSL